MALPIPSVKRVSTIVAKLKKGDKYDGLDQRALTLLFDLYPRNTSEPRVLLKVAALNHLYSTKIINIRDVAKCICQSNIDSYLRSGSVRAVDCMKRMTIGNVTRGTYSFATKYCSYHDVESYPIFDKYVMRALTAYRMKDHFHKFSQDDLKDYAFFKSVLVKFRAHYRLDTVNTSDLDKFLWKVGRDLTRRSKATK